jgi:poly(A) polymerase
MGPRIALAAIPEPGRRALGLLVDLAGADRRVWLVGGAVRQLLAAEPLVDLDVAVPSGALALGRRLADGLGASFVVLDEARGAGRIVGGAGQTLPIDLVDFRAPSLEDDLRARDFTVNALALSLADLLREGHAEVADVTGGLGDLAERVVRACGPTAVADDPVRALRGVHLAMRDGWRLEPGTEAAIRSGCGTSWWPSWPSHGPRAASGRSTASVR